MMRNAPLVAIYLFLPILLALMCGSGVGQANRTPAEPSVTPAITPSPQNENDRKSPTPDATKTEQVQASSWYTDRSVLAGALQGIAALIAVLMGFGLSVFAEKRAWNRRKIEQIREKQLLALLAFLSNIQELAEQAQRVSQELKNATSSLPQIGPTGGSAVLEAARDKLKLRAAEWLKELDNERRVALLRVTELRLLKIGEEALGCIVETMATVERLMAQVAKIQPESITTTISEFDNCLAALLSTSDVLVESAIRSLHD